MELLTTSNDLLLIFYRIQYVVVKIKNADFPSSIILSPFLSKNTMNVNFLYKDGQFQN